MQNQNLQTPTNSLQPRGLLLDCDRINIQLGVVHSPQQVLQQAACQVCCDYETASYDLTLTLESASSASPESYTCRKVVLFLEAAICYKFLTSLLPKSVVPKSSG